MGEYGENPVSVLFVCMGNICRSPLAEGVFRHLAIERGLDVLADSAGTGGWHAGNLPDPRSVAVAAAHGIDIRGQRARKVALGDFARHDLILAMDGSNLADLERIRPAGATATLALYLDHALGQSADVPDPYYGGRDGFEHVYRMIREASAALVDRLGRRSG